jgi:hypothetical protein
MKAAVTNANKGEYGEFSVIIGMNVNVVKITQTNNRMLILTKANSFLVLYIFYLKIANIDYIISYYRQN